MPVDLAKVQRSADGQFEVTARMDVEMARGVNQLHLEAINASGRRISAPVVVTYVPPPLTVVINSLETIEPRGVPILAEREAQGRITFPKGVQAGRVKLSGSVCWGDNKAAHAHKGLTVRVFVNGFQQQPVYLKPWTSKNPLRLPFETELLLSWEKSNHISLTAQEQDAADHSEFVVDCEHPVKDQRLHVLILAPQSSSARELKAEVLKAVQSRPDVQPLKTPAFQEVYLYRLLVGSQVQSYHIYEELLRIQENIGAWQGKLAKNDVVMVYYQGAETVTERGNYFRAYAPSQAQEMVKDLGIPCDKLVNILAQTQGAHVLMLDVERDPQFQGGALTDVRDKITRWKDDYPQAQDHMGVLRCIWMGKVKPPPEARLLTAMGKALPQKARLSEVLSFMNELFAPLRKAQLLSYTYDVPKDLQGLLVGGSSR